MRIQCVFNRICYLGYVGYVCNTGYNSTCCIIESVFYNLFNRYLMLHINLYDTAVHSAAVYLRHTLGTGLIHATP